MIDDDNTGEISPQELRMVLESLGDTVTDKEIKEMIKAADTNGDGEIQFDEFVDACMQGKLLDNKKI